MIYTGLFQTPDTVAAAAVQEDVDCVGISMLSGAHLVLVPAVVEAMRKVGLGHVPVVVGGIIPDQDIPAMQEAGVAAILTPGAGADEVVDAVRAAIERATAAHTGEL